MSCAMPSSQKKICFAMRRGKYEGRLDVQFYLPKHCDLEYRMKKSGFPVFPIGSPAISIQVVDGPFGSDLKVDEYVSEGIPLIRVSNCRTGEIRLDEEMVFISPEKHMELIRSEVLPGDVLLTKAGAILGYSAVFPSNLKCGNITSHLAAIRPAQGVISRYLSEFLTSNIGIQQIYRWGNKSTRPELNTDEVRSLLVVLPKPEKQMQLVEAMDAARRDRRTKLQQAEDLLAGLGDFVLRSLGLSFLTKDKRKFFALPIRGLDRRRLDAFFYQPNLVHAESVAHQYDGGIVKLGSLLTFPPVNGLDAREYVSPGRKYLRVQNVQPFQINTSDVVRVSIGQKEKTPLVSEDILLTRKGTFGVAAKVEKNCTDCLISSEVMLLRLNKKFGISSDFLVAWLNSTVIQTIFNRWKSGAIMGHITQDVVCQIPVPNASREVQQTITKQVQDIRCRATLLKTEAEIGLEKARQWFVKQLLEPNNNDI